MRVCMLARVYVVVRACDTVCACVRVQVCAYVCVYVHIMCVCVYYVYMCIHTKQKIGIYSWTVFWSVACRMPCSKIDPHPRAAFTYLTGAEESKQIQRLHTLLGVFFPARCSNHLHLRNQNIFCRARPFFPITHCFNNLIPIRSLQQHTQTQTTTLNVG